MFGITKDSRACDVWRELFEQLQPFRTNAIIVRGKAGDAAARPRQAVDEARTDWVDGQREHDRYGAGCLPQGRNSRAAGGEDHVRSPRHQFGSVSANIVRIAS